jgi:hypothetical protein
MGSKRYRGFTCVYCAHRISATADHVFARQFFLPDSRDQLPIVPACALCNSKKSNLEHYLATVLPFGGRHADARQNLTSSVPGRLAKNLRLARDLNSHRGRVWHHEDGIIRWAMTVPIEPEKLRELFGQIVRGLAWHHFSVALRQDDSSDGMILSRSGTQLFDRMFTMNAANRIVQDLGAGTVHYQGVQAVDNPLLTLWRFKFYGGIALSGDPRNPNVVSTEIAGITGPRRMVNLLGERVDA